MDKSILIDGFLNWKYKKFNRRNPSRWLDSPILQDLYDYTCGPFNSPDPVECFILYEIAKNSNHDILEFGSWRGRSSCFLAKGIQDSSNPNRKLYCIDWFKGDNTGGAGAEYEDMIRSLEFFGLDDYTKIHNNDMLTINYEEILSNTKVDFVFYDSDHSCDPTVAVLSRIQPILENDSIICMHDSRWHMPREALSRLSSMYKELKMINVWEGFSILQKNTGENNATQV